MSTFKAFYLRANGKATLEAIRQGFDKMDIEQYHAIIGVRLPGSPPKARKAMLTRLSEMFSTDVHWLSFQSAMDCFELHHWQSSQHVRSLVFGVEEERTWERAEGVSEPWEPKFLFHPRNMECELADAEDDQQRKLTKRVYNDARIEVGRIVPCISSKGTADAFAHHYGFPFFDLS